MASTLSTREGIDCSFKHINQVMSFSDRKFSNGDGMCSVIEHT